MENHTADRNDAHEEGLGCGIIGSISNGSRTGRTKTSRLDYVCPVHVRTAHSRSGRVLVHYQQWSTEISQCRISDISPHWRTGDPS